MDSTFNYIFKVTSTADKVTAGMQKLNATVEKIEHSTADMDKAFGKAFKNMQNQIATIKLTSILDQVDRVSNGLSKLNKPGLDLNANMHELQAITGVAGQKLKEIEGYARQNALTFGGTASDGVESYKLILSQLNPEIAKTPKALQAMGTNVSITSKLMKGDAVAATELLTTAMNQYQVSTDNPIEASKQMANMMNVMAAAAKEGSAELPQIKSALEQSGMAAKAANISFEETNAAIQVLDKAGKKGAEGGVALRNVMATLSEGRFLPKDVKKELTSAGVDINTLGNKNLTLVQRLKPLQKIMNDSALITKLFGKENSNAALAMISGIDETQRLTAAIKGTDEARKQAAVVMESDIEKNARLKAKVDDMKISLYNATDGWLGYASAIGDIANDFSNLAPLISGTYKAISTLANAEKRAALWTSIVTAATSGWAAVQAVFNAIMAMNPIVLVVLAIIALIGVIAWVASSTEGWGKLWEHTVNGAKLLFFAYVEAVKFYFSTMVNVLMMGINLIKKGWYEFKEAVGIGDSSENQKMLAKINADTESRKKAIVDGAKKVKDLGVKAAKEFEAAANSVHWKKEKKEGIDEPGVAGAADMKKFVNPVSGDSKTKTNEAIATGGSKSNYITINLKDLIGVLNIYAKDFKDGSKQMADQSQDALLRVLAMAATSAE